MITILDTTRPVITCPAPITVYESPTCTIDTATTNTGKATATDNCNKVITQFAYANLKVNGSCPYNYTINRTWTATDSCGNTSNPCVQVITILDTIRPVITCPAPITVYESPTCTIDTATTNTGKATATDNCNKVITQFAYTNAKVNGSCPYNYTINRTWTATDSCGNTSNPCVQVITILDTIRPSDHLPCSNHCVRKSNLYDRYSYNEYRQSDSDRQLQ